MEFEKIVKLIEAVSVSALTAFELEENGTRISLEKKPVSAASVQSAATVPQTEPSAMRVLSSVPVMQTPVSATPALQAASLQAESVSPAAQPVSVQSVAAPQQASAPAAGQPMQVQPVTAVQQIAAGAYAEEKIVKAPLVGTFYAAPSEDAEPFVKVGDTVKKGQVLGIIEAMKLMNEIESEFDGVIEAVLISNEQVVEYGQPLFRIRQKG